MIWLYGSPSLAFKRSFKTFEELCDYFKRYEQLSCSYLDDSYSQTQKWDFVYHPHRRFSSLCERLKEQLNAIEMEAYENELDLIDVYAGSTLYPEQYPVTANLNVEVLMRQWVLDYAFAHGFRVLQTFSNGVDGASISNALQNIPSAFSNPNGNKEYFGMVNWEKGREFKIDDKNE